MRADRRVHWVVVTTMAVALAGCGVPSPPAEPSRSPGESTPRVSSSAPGTAETPSPTSTGPTRTPDERRLIESPTQIVGNLAAPWSVAFHGDIPLISERDSGRILEVGPDGSLREVAVIEEVVADGEGGLLGMAVDDADRLFVYYTGASDNRIVRFDVSGSAGSLSLGEPTVIVDGIAKSSTHNGGRLAFGPDAMLYATTGDAGRRDSAQDQDGLSGKILRMTGDGEAPPDNPFAGSLVWSMGHRNPQGIAWGDDGTMFSTEFGQDTWDELNIILPGKNYGWPRVEGAAGNADFVDPVQQWAPGDASPSGLAHHDGVLYIANLRGQALRRVPVDDLSTSTVPWDGDFGRLRDVVVSPAGDLWVLTNNTDGRGTPVTPDDDRVIAISPEALGE